ncbi:major capsid protein [Planctobacterium marinum]|uniref:major capsid protein n=1 Tax=Planctobacterium marinum TaxID=1631968 RepID=UPI001E409076|nr:major capsid protein [Planctobacterium marinum]MCC2604094.1 major capsid protein [Planctobacterium marinum]
MKNLKSKILLATAAIGSTVMSGVSYAIDTTAVQTAITAAETDALTTGEYVIGTVASLVVIGLIVTMVRKI